MLEPPGTGHMSVDPGLIFPILAGGFLALAGWQVARTRQLRGAAATWLIVASCFGGVALALYLVRA